YTTLFRSQVYAHGVMALPVECQAQFGADAVGPRNQHRLLEVGRHFEQCAKASDSSHDARAHGLGGQWLDAIDQGIARVDIHACIAVGQGNRRIVFHEKSRGICENCELDEIVRHMTEQLILDISPAPPASLDNFVAGANQAALQALRQCAPGRAVYLWGPPGAGRTHLLRAMASRDDSRYFSAD